MAGDRDMTSRTQPEPIRRPEKILGEVRLDRYKDLAGFLTFGPIFFGPLILHYVFSVSNPLVYGLGFFGAIFVFFCGIRVMLDPFTEIIYWDVIKILISPTGLYLEDAHGQITYMLPFSEVKTISYWNDEDGFSSDPGSNIHNWQFVCFQKVDKKDFKLLIDYVIAADREKIIPLLASIKNN